MQAGRVDRRYVPHPDDQHLRLAGDPAHPVLEQLRGTKEERARDLVNLDTLGDHATADRVRVVLEVVHRVGKLVRQHADVRHLGHAARTMPTSIATVRSTSTVNRNVVSSTATSLFGARNSDTNVRHSLMWKATTTRIP